MELVIKHQSRARAGGNRMGGRVVKCMMLGMRIRDVPVRREKLWGQRVNKAKIVKPG